MSAGATAAAGPAARRGRRAGRPRPRRDPHVDPSIRRKLPDRQRCLLDALYARLTRTEDRLRAIAARHGEVL